jgi:hypothetical protein
MSGSVIPEEMHIQWRAAAYSKECVGLAKARAAMLTCRNPADR